LMIEMSLIVAMRDPSLSFAAVRLAGAESGIHRGGRIADLF